MQIDAQHMIDHRVRMAARNAPANVKRAIDRTRGRYGMAPLWHVERRSQQAASDWCVLVGACAPGRSSPVIAATDGLHIPEEIAPDAFEHSLRCIKARAATVELESGHGGVVIASTANGTLAFTASHGTGLMCVARVRLTRANTSMLAAAMRGRMGLSVSMLPKRVEIVKRNGKRVRVIREVELRAVAALWDTAEHGKACYPAARVWAAFESDTRGVRRAMRAAGIHANTAVLKAGWR